MIHPLDSLISSKFTTLIQNLVDDIESIEMILKIKKDASKTLKGKILKINEKNDSMPSDNLHISLKIMQSEVVQAEFVASFLGSSILGSLKALKDKISMDMTEFKESLKDYFEVDNKIHQQEINSKNGSLEELLLRRKRLILFNRNRVHIRNTVDLAVRSINGCVSDMKTEFIRIQGNLEKSIPVPLMIPENWANINTNSLMDLIENEVTPASCVESETVFSEIVQVKKGWGRWQRCKVMLLVDTAIFDRDDSDQDKKLDTFYTRHFKLDDVSVSEKDKDSVDVVKKKQGVMSWLFGLDSLSVRFPSDFSREYFMKFVNSGDRN